MTTSVRGVEYLDKVYDNAFALNDRIAKIKSMQEQHDLEKHGYVSFSGGKDSAVVSALLDEALPGNRIPRVFFNTGMEMRETVRYVKSMAEQDDRIVIVPPSMNIREMLERDGYPVKSKLHSQHVSRYQRRGMALLCVRKYLGEIEPKYNKPVPPWLRCPDNMRYQFTPDFTLKVSSKCCNNLKKKPGAKWSKEHDRKVVILGLRVEEGGVRSTNYIRNGATCVVFTPHQTKFSPLMPCSEEFVNWYVKRCGVRLSKLYSPPFSASRTGCRGCPYNAELKKDLMKMSLIYPADFKAACLTWRPVYEEYIKIGRLPKSDMFFDYGYRR